nr:helix-turn-helix transcriptional regulator [uncultured Blautia sp.]
MPSIDIFVENLNRIAKHYNLRTYREIADYLHVTEDALKRWQNKSRTPSLKKIDEISDRIKCYSYSLLQKDGDLFVEIEYIKNNSRNALLSNLRDYFMQYGRFSWNDKAALFYGFVSEDVLKSYFREENYKTPPLSKLDEMAEALGKPTYELIKEVGVDEKTDT